MKIEMVKLHEIREYPKNPRDIPEEAVKAIAASIKEFGFKNPVLLDKDGTIIAGHARTRAAALAGLTEVPAIRVEDLTSAQVKAYRLADNKLAELTEWNDAALGLELAELKELDFDLSLTGFDEDEVAELTGGNPGLTDPDEVPEPPKEPVTKTGDLWLLGTFTTCPHCGERNEL